MNCIKCNEENNLKDRQASGGRCKGCRHEFAFDPKVMSGIDFTDKFFQQTLTDLSVNDTLFFTTKQLYFSFNHRRNAKKRDQLQVAGGCGFAAVVGVFILLCLTMGFSGYWLIPLIPLAVFSLALLSSRRLRKWFTGVQAQELDVTPEQVAAWYTRWTKINGPCAKLLASPTAQEKFKPEAVPISSELRKYSFDRAVVCDRAEIAQCLIANNFHFEHNCAVLSIDGYPHNIFRTVMDMLRTNPDLRVYALHDASLRGIEMTHTLRSSADWFAGNNALVYDLGLLPRQILSRSIFTETSLRSVQPIPLHIASMLLPEELRWFEAGNSVALESFTPKMLLRVVAQGIAKSRDPQAVDALAPVTTDGGGMYFYAFDTFG